MPSFHHSERPGVSRVGRRKDLVQSDGESIIQHCLPGLGHQATIPISTPNAVSEAGHAIHWRVGQVDADPSNGRSSNSIANCPCVSQVSATAARRIPQHRAARKARALSIDSGPILHPRHMRTRRRHRSGAMAEATAAQCEFLFVRTSLTSKRKGLPCCHGRPCVPCCWCLVSPSSGSGPSCRGRPCRGRCSRPAGRSAP